MIRFRRKMNPVTRGLLLGGAILFWFGVFHFRGRDNENPSFSGRKRSLLEVNDTFSSSNHQDQSNETSNCIKPAIEQFPEPVIGKWGRKRGGVIIHIFVAFYMFIGLSIACDDYFVPALDRISDVLNLPPDVAGATFMAAGSSAPELATAVIGVFVAQDDIGISGVIGSAIFNITLVIAVCALASEHVFYLNWYSVTRDCVCYLLSILILLITISNELVSWYEALIFLILYGIYCVAMGYNSKFETWANRVIPVPESWKVAAQQGGLQEPNYDSMATKTQTNGGTASSIEMGAGTEIPLTPLEEKKDSNLDEAVEDPLRKPEGNNKILLLKWALLYPLYKIVIMTIPDCRREKWANFYALTFLISILWISLYSYIMVWMITVIGFTFGIPDTVMGLTFIAAGVSVPDALSGIAVVKEGHGDMAVSNAIGSNVFDILVCLGVPWFIKTAIIDPGSYVTIKSKGLVYSTISLFSTVVFLILASHFNGWKLDKKYGIILLVWYFLFMTFASMYELNVFGYFNPPECSSGY